MSRLQWSKRLLSLADNYLIKDNTPEFDELHVFDTNCNHCVFELNKVSSTDLLKEGFDREEFTNLKEAETKCPRCLNKGGSYCALASYHSTTKLKKISCPRCLTLHEVIYKEILLFGKTPITLVCPKCNYIIKFIDPSQYIFSK